MNAIKELARKMLALFHGNKSKQEEYVYVYSILCDRKMGKVFVSKEEAEKALRELSATMNFCEKDFCVQSIKLRRK